MTIAFCKGSIASDALPARKRANPNVSRKSSTPAAFSSTLLRANSTARAGFVPDLAIMYAALFRAPALSGISCMACSNNSIDLEKFLIA